LFPIATLHVLLRGVVQSAHAHVAQLVKLGIFSRGQNVAEISIRDFDPGMKPGYVSLAQFDDGGVYALRLAVTVAASVLIQRAQHLILNVARKFAPDKAHNIVTSYRR
jgi:hypothetical protein